MIVTIDLPTLSAVTLATSLLLPPALLAAGVVAGRVPGIDDWVRGAMAFVVGFALLMLRGQVSDLLSVVVANVLIVFGHSQVANGCRRFFRLPVTWRWDWALTAMVAIPVAIFTYAEPSRPARIFVVSLGIALCALVAAHSMLPAARADRSRSRHVLLGVSGLLGITALAMMARAFINLSFALGAEPDAATTTIEGLHLLIGSVTNLGVTAALPLLVALRVGSDLLESRRRLERIHEVGLLGFVEVEMSSGRADTSAVYDAIFGLTPDMPRTAAQWLDMIHPDDRSIGEARLRAFATADAPLPPFEYRILRGTDGQTRWIWSTSDRTLDAAGTVKQISTIVVDITDRKEAEIAMRKAHKATEAASLAKSEFLANMSHELRTPLHGVLGNAQLLADSPLEDDQRLCVDGVLDNARNLLVMVDDVLDHASLDTGTLSVVSETVDLPALLHRLRREFQPTATRRRLELTVLDLPVDAPSSIAADHRRMHQVLSDLLSNAFKFTDSGTVTLGVAVLDAGALPPAGGMRIFVRDTGIGIEAAAVDHLFDPFYQADASISRRHGGAGLGLSLAKRLVEMMGGGIGVESAPGAGSTFNLDFPHAGAGDAATELPAGFDARSLLEGALGDFELARTIAAGSAADLRGALAALESARAGHDATAAARAAHTLWTLCAPLGARSLAARMKAMEQELTDWTVHGREATLSVPHEAILALADAAERWAVENS